MLYTADTYHRKFIFQFFYSFSQFLDVLIQLFFLGLPIILLLYYSMLQFQPKQAGERESQEQIQQPSLAPKLRVN